MTESKSSGAVEFLTLPSTATIGETAQALQRTVDQVRSDCREILQTLAAIGEMLDTLKVSGGSGPGLGLGMIGLPIPIAARAALIPINAYLKEKTGLSVDGWAEFLDSTRVQFDAYLEQIGKVATLSAHYRATTVKGEEPSPQQLDEHQELLEDVKAKTNVWRPLLGQLARMVDLVDSIIESTHERASAPDFSGQRAEPVLSAQGTFSWIRNLAGGGSETTVGVQDILEGLLTAGLGDLKGRSDRLQEQVEQVAGSVDDLEDLLDLELAQIQACSGGLPDEEVQLIGRRVAVTVLLPRLLKNLGECRKGVTDYETYLDRLESAKADGEIVVSIYELLRAEYLKGLETEKNRLADLQADATAWNAQGRRGLEAGMDWITQQQGLITARARVGQLGADEVRDRSKALAREANRLGSAMRELDALQASVT